MQLTEGKVTELQKIVKESYGEEISERAATEMAIGLFGYLDMLVQIYKGHKKP